MPRRVFANIEERKQANREKANRYYKTHRSSVLEKLKEKTKPIIQRNQEHLILRNRIRQLCSLAIKLEYDNLKAIIDQIEQLMTSSDVEPEYTII